MYGWRQYIYIYMATNHPSRKPSKLDEQDMRDTTGEVRTNSLAVTSGGYLARSSKCSTTSIGQPRTYLQQLRTDTGCSLEDLLEVMDDRDEWLERVREICASSTIWWWWGGGGYNLSVNFFVKFHNLRVGFEIYVDRPPAGLRLDFSSRFLSPSLSLSLSFSLSLTHTRARTLAHSHTPTLFHTHTHTHTHTLSLSLSLSLCIPSLSHTHSLSFSLSLFSSPSLSLSHTHTHSLSLFVFPLSNTHSVSFSLSHRPRHLSSFYI